MSRPACATAVLIAAALLLPAGSRLSAQAPPPPRAGAGPDTVDLVVAATTDVHGRLRGWDYYRNAPDSARGLAREATIIDSLRRAHPGHVVLVDAGDFLQGNPLAFVAARISRRSAHPVIAAMNAMGYDAAAIGNHEYNYGVPLLRRAAAQARFPLLSANTWRAAPSGGRAFPAFRIVRRSGVRIGIVGATTPGVMVWDRDHARGQVRLGDIVPAVRQAVGEARRAGAQVIVVAVHSGLNEPSSYDTVTTGVPSENVAARVAHEVAGVDLVVYGHSHQEMADTVIGSTLLVQAKNWATSVAVAHLTVVRDGHSTRVTGRRGAIVRAAGHAESPAVLAATDSSHRETVQWAGAPLGSTPVAWRGDSARVRDTPLIDFVLEVERRHAGTDLASTAAFTLDAGLDSGAITVAELARLYPYDNTLRAVRISGRQLREYLEFSARYYADPRTPGRALDPRIPGYNFDIVAGADYALDISRPIGQRLTRLEVHGRPVADADSFTMALNNYRQTGGGGYAMLRGAPLVYDRQEDIRQLLIDEVRGRGTLRPADYFTRNWTLEPDAAVSRAWGEMTGLGTTQLRIIATNDFHGALEPRPDARGVLRGGAGVVAAQLAAAAAECRPGCETLLVDGGDLFQGTPASNLAYGRPVVDIYNTDGYAATALGNHEFDWGTDTLRARMREARFRILGANVRDTAGRDVDWIPNDTIVARGALRIGIIGVATVVTPRTTKAANTVGLRFDEPAPIVDSIAAALRARGAQAIVVVAHAGGFCARDGATDCGGEIVDLARHLHERIDAIVSGHTHSLVDVVVNGIPIVQARSRGQAIAVIDLAIGAGGSTMLSHQVRDVVAGAGGPAPDARVDSIVTRAVLAVATLANRPVAEIAGPMRPDGPQYALGNLIADAQRWAGKADVAVMNNGGIRAPLLAGTATYGTLFEVQPFANVLVRLTVTGRALRAYLERLVSGAHPGVHVSGVVVSYSTAQPAGARITGVKLADGRALDDAGTYTVVMNDFMASGGNDLSLNAQATSVETLSVSDLDALIGYLTSRPGPVPPPADARLIEVAR